MLEDIFNDIKDLGPMPWVIRHRMALTVVIGIACFVWGFYALAQLPGIYAKCHTIETITISDQEYQATFKSYEAYIYATDGKTRFTYWDDIRTQLKRGHTYEVETDYYHFEYPVILKVIREK